MPYGSASYRPLTPRPAPAPVAAVVAPSYQAVGPWQGPFASHPLYDIELEASTGLIVVRTRGFWSVDEVDDYFDLLGELVVAARLRFGRAKVLVDVVNAPLQSADVAERFSIGNRIFDQPNDKVALITSSSLQKMQIRRTLPGDRFQAFVSQAAALMWINAYP